MNNNIDETYLNLMFETFQNERNKLMLELKNDKELKNNKEIENKINSVERITKEILKYRNTIIKSKIKKLNDF